MVYDLNGTTLSTGGGSSGMLNVLDHGFKGDGTTDNLAAFNALIAAHPAETLYFPKGVYAFSGKLVIDFCYMVLDNAELKCTAATKVNRFIEIRGKMTPIGHPRQDMFIRGNGKVNANFKADDCIAVARQKCTLIDHISIQNFQRYGICGKFEDASMETEGLVASNRRLHVHRYRHPEREDGTLVQWQQHLPQHPRLVLRFRPQRPRYPKGPDGEHRFCVHSREWPPLLGLLLRHLPERIQILRRALAYITNFRWYIAAETWPTDLPAYVFPANPTGQAMYKVFGADINGSGVTKFSDVDLSSQTNCRWYGIVHNLSDAPSTLQ